MKLIYGITVSTEEEEIVRLLKFLKSNIDNEIVVQYDTTKTSSELLSSIENFDVHLIGEIFRDNFADFKNTLNEHCISLGGDYIFQLDADEMITDYLTKNIEVIINMNSEIDLFLLPRINKVDGMTEEYIKKWGWNVDDKGRINFPDYQGRLYKSNMKWSGKVHERIVDAKYFSVLPMDDEYCIGHYKTLQKQIQQNNLYSTI
jgi:hypothetical protein